MGSPDQALCAMSCQQHVLQLKYNGGTTFLFLLQEKAQCFYRYLSLNPS